MRYRGYTIAFCVTGAHQQASRTPYRGIVINELTDADVSSIESSKTYTVLIIDDNAEDRYLLKRYLKKTGLSLLVLEASSGQEGIDLLTSPITVLAERYSQICPPVILFLDINMPIMNGWEFVETLEARENDIQLKPTVVMMYSTADADDEKIKAKNYQSVEGYIVKGNSTPEDLRQAVLNGAGKGKQAWT